LTRSSQRLVLAGRYHAVCYGYGVPAGEWSHRSEEHRPRQ